MESCSFMTVGNGYAIMFSHPVMSAEEKPNKSNKGLLSTDDETMADSYPANDEAYMADSDSDSADDEAMGYFYSESTTPKGSCLEPNCETVPCTLPCICDLGSTGHFKLPKAMFTNPISSSAFAV